MKLLSHGPEPCASANSAISAFLISSLNFYTVKRREPRRSCQLNPHFIITANAEIIILTIAVHTVSNTVTSADKIR